MRDIASILLAEEVLELGLDVVDVQAQVKVHRMWEC